MWGPPPRPAGSGVAAALPRGSRGGARPIQPHRIDQYTQWLGVGLEAWDRSSRCASCTLSLRALSGAFDPQMYLAIRGRSVGLILRILQAQYYSPVNLAGSQLSEYWVDVLQPGLVDVGTHLAPSGKFERFREILACANDRSTHSDAFEHHIDDRHRKCPRWQADQTHGTPAACQLQRLRKCRRRRRRHKHAMGAAIRAGNHLRDCVTGFGIDREFGASGACQRQLLLADIQRDHA